MMSAHSDPLPLACRCPFLVNFSQPRVYADTLMIKTNRKTQKHQHLNNVIRLLLAFTPSLRLDLSVVLSRTTV